MSKSYRVAILGATGAVGTELLELLESRNFPLADLKLLASERSAGKTLRFKGEDIPVEAVSDRSLENIDIVLASAGGSISKIWAGIAVQKGAVVIDNSSAFRMNPDVPLVVPEVNPQAAFTHKGIIANPISSPHYWKASTFGGQIGFDIVKTTTIRDLFCRNMKPGECGHISFKLPDNNNNNNNDKMNNNAADDHIVLDPSSPAVQSSIIHSQSSLSSTKTFSPAAGRMTSTPQFTANYRSLTVDDLDFIECHQPTTAGQRSKHRQHSNNYCNLREVYAL